VNTRNGIVALVACCALSAALASAPAFAAAPSVADVEASVGRGDFEGANEQLAQVIREHPQNARARYMHAQVLERLGRYAPALGELQAARQIDPATAYADPARVSQLEASLQARAARSATARTTDSGGVAQAPAASSHGASPMLWLGLLIVLAGVAAVLVWTVRRGRNRDGSPGGADDATRLGQLKRTTTLLNDARTLKLDVRLSPRLDKDALAREVEDIETGARALVETLEKGPVDDYRIVSLEQALVSVRARSEGRPDPTARVSDAAPGYAPDAGRFGRGGDPYGNSAYGAPGPGAPQQTVIVQQPPGAGGMGGMGGLLTGVVLGGLAGQAFGRGRNDLPDERGDAGRDTTMDPGPHGAGNVDPGPDAGWNDPGLTPEAGGFDAGQGDDHSWDDASSNDSGFDPGAGDDDWNNT
jgi:tetratricopeptide (TPR) repeat protein